MIGSSTSYTGTWTGDVKSKIDITLPGTSFDNIEITLSSKENQANAHVTADYGDTNYSMTLTRE